MDRPAEAARPRPATGEATRVARRSRPAGGQQTAAGHRGGEQPRRHLADIWPPRPHRRARASHRGDRVRERRDRRRRRHRINPHTRQQHRERHPHRFRPPREPAHPAAHRLGRPPQRRGHRPGTRPSRLRSQRRPDHRHQIRTPQQREHRQQNMRHTTPAAARPPRPHRHRRRITPQHPRPGPPPRPQRPPAIRTLQLIPGKPVLDPGSICPYREHSASARDTALPGRLGQRDTGRAFVCPHRHGAAANEHDHRPRHTPRSVGTQHAWNRTRYQQPQRRSTHGEATTGPKARRNTNLIAAICPCGRSIRVAASTLAEAPITCQACDQDFQAKNPADA